MKTLFRAILIVIGALLIIDQLWLFGIPIGPLFVDLSQFDPTQSPLIHHWMLGVVMILFAVFVFKDGKRRNH